MPSPNHLQTRKTVSLVYGRSSAEPLLLEHAGQLIAPLDNGDRNSAPQLLHLILL